MDRFIVGTGRCGSTLLSRMLAENETLLSLFEFFNGLDIGQRFRPEAVDGSVLADLLSREQPFVRWVLERGYEVVEITYPFGRGRYRREDPLPWILVSVLPRITDDPDALFDETLAFAASLPRQPLRDHYRSLFDWWTRELGRECWLERSGSSVEYLGALCALFPEARFVHLHRDGPEAALSMREHHAYRLAVSFLYGLHEDAPDRVDRILSTRPPAHLYGRYWSDQLVRGYEAISRLPPDRLLHVRFEDLVGRPRDTLLRIARFLALEPGPWIERGAALVRGVPSTRLETLPGAEREALSEACRPGRELLGR